MAANQVNNNPNTKQSNIEKESQNPQKKPKNSKKPGLFLYLLPILLAASIILGIWGYFIHSNKFGLGEKMRPVLKNVLIVRDVLPPNPDPEAAEYMSDDELASKYEEYRAKIKELTKKVDEQTKTIADLQKYKDNQVNALAGVTKQKLTLDAEAKKIAAERKQLQADKLQFAKDVKNVSKADFTAYFEKMDKDIAAQVYKEVLEENQVSAEVSSYVKTFESMEPANASSVLENMGYSNMELVVNIMKKMKSKTAAQIIANMDPVFAANLEDSIAVDYPIYPKQ